MSGVWLSPRFDQVNIMLRTKKDNTGAATKNESKFMGFRCIHWDKEMSLSKRATNFLQVCPILPSFLQPF